MSVRALAAGTRAGKVIGGRAVAGSYAAGSRSWRTRWALAPSRAYRVTATAVDAHGRRTVVSSIFRTLRPRRTFGAATVLGAGETVGVGMPIMIDFTRPITDRGAVERALQIWSSKPVTGAWYWATSESVWFRPRHYWPAHTRVRFTAHLSGVQGAPDVYGRSDLTQHFRIGDSLIAVASVATHYMKVWWNGRLAGDWPVSTGRSGMDTPDGRYLSFAKGSPVDMNSASYGVGPGMPGYYNELVYDAVQFTFSGDYVHSAPWSVGEQGIANVSHGCVNLAPGYAAWSTPIRCWATPSPWWAARSPGRGAMAGRFTSRAGAGCSRAAPPGTRCGSARPAAAGPPDLPRDRDRGSQDQSRNSDIPGSRAVPRGSAGRSVSGGVFRAVLAGDGTPAFPGGDGGMLGVTELRRCRARSRRGRFRARWSRGRCPPGAGRSR